MTGDSDGELGVSDTIDHSTSRLEDVGDMNPVGSESTAREELYIARAIENDGIDADIIGIDVNDVFQTVIVKRRHRGNRTKVSEYASIEEAIESADGENSDAIFFSIKYSPKFDIYYKTPFGEIYKTTIDTSVSRKQLSVSQSNRKFLKEMWTQAYTSDQHESLSAISDIHSLKAEFEPSEDMSNGKLHINNSQIQFSGAEQVDVPRTSSNVDQAIKSIVNTNPSNSQTDIETNVGPNHLVWRESYISNVMEDENGENVYLTVPVDGRKVIFPLKVSYDTEKPIWDIIEQAGGDLVDVRGMNVYIRERWPITDSYRDDYYDYGTSLHMPDAYALEHHIRTTHLYSDDTCRVTPITIDTNYEWTLGVTQRYEDEGETTEDESFIDQIKGLIK